MYDGIPERARDRILTLRREADAQRLAAAASRPAEPAVTDAPPPGRSLRLVLWLVTRRTGA